ncbi:molecular chaperone [Pseudomonas sp. TE3610]
MSAAPPPPLLRAPTPSQANLTFCEATPRDLKRWIATLPKANLGETARQLYQGLIELSQLITPSENRLQLLELLRPEVYFVCSHLERHFLNQSVVLDERARKIANLCQALQNLLAVGYKQVVLRVISRLKDRNLLLATAIERAMHALKGPLVRASLLYCPVPEGLWLELHQLYQVALKYQLHRTFVDDELVSQKRQQSIEHTYATALLMGSSRCNQMRQQAIVQLANVLEPWSALTRVVSASDASAQFAVAPDADAPPRYKSLFPATQLPQMLGLDPHALVKAITEWLHLPADQRQRSGLLVPPGLTIDMLQHLAAAWGDVAERTFHRTPGQGTMSVCIGMSTLHYYLGGERSFSELLKRPEAGQSATFSASKPAGASDGWSLAFDAAKTGDSHGLLPYEEIEYPAADLEGGPANAAREYPVHELQIVNHSPGGYCLAWLREVPAQLQAGELVGIQDAPSQGWSVAVVRWIRQVRGGGTQMGIELIAPHAQPCGLQLLRSNQESSQYVRGLQLPEIRAIDIQASLIAPRLPFQEGQKVMINTHGEENRANLGRKVSSTGSFNQFEFRILEAAPAAAQAESEFDSLWKDL